MNKTPFAIAALMMTASVGCLAQPEPDGDDNVSTSTAELKAAGACRIDGVTYAAGALDPADPCQSCEPKLDKRAWTVVDATCYEPAPPATCESNRDCDGQACIDGLCTFACTMDSQCGPPLHCVAGSGCIL